MLFFAKESVMNYDPQFLDSLRSAAITLQNKPSDYDSLLDRVGDAQIVLIGEATHGTHEFYDMRAQISKRLIAEKGFRVVAIEGDWPDAYQVNRYIHSQMYVDARDALSSFDRFPTWMWRNNVMIDFVEWMKNYNQRAEPDKKVSFFGLDIYSLYRSVDVVINYLGHIDPEAAKEARFHYSCFDHFRQDPQAYGYAVYNRVIESCAGDVIEQLRRLLENDWELLAKGKISSEEAFYIEQNARVVKNAEHYYRSLFGSQVSNWNIRDSHMLETLKAIINHYQLSGVDRPKIIIWAHNSHVGNAAATQMTERGEYNIGQLVKHYVGSKNSITIGFTTYNGTVSAASNWHHPVERKMVRDALPNSYEALFHAVGIPKFLLQLQNAPMMPLEALERAIGVVYLPNTERSSHYFFANIVGQFDIIIHCDKTTAVEPLEKTSEWIKGEIPETYPTGL